MHVAASTGRVVAGRYLLQHPIGRGAMGTVWRAQDSLLARDVAVKEVRLRGPAPDATDPAAAGGPLTEETRVLFERTLREARTAARLNHPAVITVFDVIEEADGSPWIVMELIQGRSLEQVVAGDGPLLPYQAASLGARLLSALGSAHAAGILHRDVKPSNVLLGANGRAVLTDFGIATLEGDIGLTQAGMVMGTPGFTAPERVRGEPASPASDLWSLGATLFAAVEGHGPFDDRQTPLAILAAIANEDAPQPQLAGPLRPAIEALLGRDPRVRPDAAAAARLLASARNSASPGGPAHPAQLEAAASDTAPWWAGPQQAGVRGGAGAGLAGTGAGPGGAGAGWAGTAAGPGAGPAGAGPAGAGWPGADPEPRWLGAPLPVAGPEARPAGTGTAEWAPAGLWPADQPDPAGGPAGPRPALWPAGGRHGTAGPGWPAWVPASLRTRLASTPRWVLAAVAGLLIVLAGLLTGLAVASASHHGTGTTSGAAARAGLYRTYRPKAGGFTVQLPAGWHTAQHGRSTAFTNPARTASVRVFPVPFDGAGIAEAQLLEAAEARHGYPGYQGQPATLHLVRLAAGRAISWSYSWQPAQGSRREVLETLLHPAGLTAPRGFLIQESAPASAVTGTEPAFGSALRTFRAQS